MENENKNLNDNGEELKNVETPKTLDEYLKEPTIQAEFDRKLENAKKKWEKSWQEKAEAEKSEAERLAKMSEQEKQQDAINKAIKAKEDAEAELNAYKLKEEAQKIATEKGLDLGLLNIIDYSKESAESVKTKIDDIEKVFKKAIESSVNEKLKQTAPKYVTGATKGTDNDAYLNQKYGNNRYYKK